MRNSLIATLLAGAALSLSACGQEAEEPAADTEMAGETATDTADMAATDSSVVDANTASEEQLAATLGMTPELAAAIVAGQPYADVTALNAVLMESLSEDEAARMRETVFVPVNLNDATREQIELIPGMTDRMVHEFQEYVPYEDMAEFDREIGKYVDEAEVARFRNYVTL